MKIRLLKNHFGIPDGGALRGESSIARPELVQAAVGIVVVHRGQAEGVLVAEQRLYEDNISYKIVQLQISTNLQVEQFLPPTSIW